MSASKNKSKGGIVTGTIIAIALTALMCGVYALLVKNGKLTDAYSENHYKRVNCSGSIYRCTAVKSKAGRRGVSGLAVGII